MLWINIKELNSREEKHYSDCETLLVKELMCIEQPLIALRWKLKGI